MTKEFCSNSLREAISMAASEFNVDAEQIKYEIITEKSKYFGHSQREIYIKAWPSDGAEEQKLSQFIQNLIERMSIDLAFSISNGKSFLTVDFYR